MSQEFIFGGFRSSKQIGQYYSLTFDNKTTRLYTSVNCLNESNIQLVQELLSTFKGVVASRRQTVIHKHKDYDIEEGSQEPILHPNAPSFEGVANNFLPLMMKIYPIGKLTNGLKNRSFSDCRLQLS